MSYRKVGGLHFVRVWRFGFAWFWSKPKPVRVERHDRTKDDMTFPAFLSWTAQTLGAAVKGSTSFSRSLNPFPKDRRVSITAMELELKIAETVKSEPGCKDFAGVIIQPKKPKSRLDPNWEVRGVRFGKADRKIANEPLAKVVARLQQEFRLTGHDQRAPAGGDLLR